MEIPFILLAGEPMGLFIAQEEGPLEEVSNFTAAVAGAEFNVAVGLSRLGLCAKYLTKLGKDPFGAKIRNTMKANGIDTSLILESREKLTGFMLKGKTRQGDPDIYYFRKESAASSICKDDIDRLNFAGCGFLHMTGVFPALSASTAKASFEMLRKARDSGMTVFFDPNLRPQLWPDKQTMIETINALAAQADYVLPGVQEGEILTGSSDPRQISEFYLSLGAKAVIVKNGTKGAYAATQQDRFISPAFRVTKVVDTVGAGDGFAVGVISAIAEGLTLKEAARRGSAMGAIQVMSRGDNEGLPTRGQLETFLLNTPLAEAEYE